MSRLIVAQAISRAGEPEHIADFVCDSVDGRADTVYIPGTAWRALEVVQQLEDRLGRTVITVNQATIWAVQQRLGIFTPVGGYGRLMADAG